MGVISIIGLGNMGAAIGARAAGAGHTVEMVGRDEARAEDLAATLGGGATAGTFGTVPTGDIVILAVPNAAAVPVVTRYGNALAGKVIVDVTNPMRADASGLTTPDGTSAAQEIAAAAPASAHVVKAFNTVFGHDLTPGRSVDVLLAGDDAPAKASVSAFVASLGLRPLDAGGLVMAHWLEGTGLLMVNLARHGVGDFTFTLDISKAG